MNAATREPATLRGGVALALRQAGLGRSEAVASLAAFCRFPSVSAQPRHRAGVERCAGWLAQYLRRVGLHDVRIQTTGGAPVVTASWLGAPGRPTLLIYGHYDVQPADLSDGWRSPPFQPRVVGDHLVARGSADDKGPLLTHVHALASWFRAAGSLPINVRVLFEGEEEVGSPTLARFLEGRPEVCAADVAVMSDTRMLGPGRPAITYGLRGAVSGELEVRGPSRDLHSGHFGGAIANPALVLSSLLNAIHDHEGRIAIPGFYDGIPTSSQGKRSASKPGTPSDAEILSHAGVSTGWGEEGYTLHERTTSRPAFTINGLTSGYQGPGGKAVIPSRASAKFNIRLVPGQDPDTVFERLRRFLVRQAPSGVEVRIRKYSTARPVLLDPSHPAIRAAGTACRHAFGRPPALLRSGGTIPVVALLAERRIPTVLLGLTLPDAGIHGPNERFHLPTYMQGIDALIWFLAELGAGGRSVVPLLMTRRSRT